MMVGMGFEQSTSAPATDRRVRRTRSALMRAAVTLVTERGTAAVSLSDLAEAADVSRQVVYQQFGDRETLLLEAALDLVRSELLPELADLSRTTDVHAPVLAVARHFADHRAFYRAILTSSCAYGLNKALTGFFLPVNQQAVDLLWDGRLGRQEADDLAAFLTGGYSALINTWVVEGDEPLDPREFSDRLIQTISAVLGPAARQ